MFWFSAAGRDIAHGTARRFPSDGGGGITRRKMAALDHAIGLEEKNFSARRFHRGTIVADARHGRGAAQRGSQTRDNLILTGCSHIR